MTDRTRRFDRISVDSVRGKLHTPRDLRVRDLSRTGLAFDTDERLEEGRDYFVELEHRGQSARLAVNVRWVRREETPAGEPPRYHVGAEFVDVLERPATGLWSWIRVVGEAEEGADEDAWPP